ncbi:redoxin domain-containing protein [Kordiimonas marina]|uniref:redoxin domain-containing protein n=1 Tax=Kordiimonas marina TaxID=2872312 RepID=UPI001FF69B2B
MRFFKICFLFLCAGWSVAAAAEPVPGKAAPAFTGTDSKGQKISLSDFRGKRVVLEWTNKDCPYVRKHYSSGNMQRLQRALTEDGAVWLSVISSAPGKQGFLTPEEADDVAAREGSYADHIILDPDGVIGRAYGASTTPHMFIIDTDGTLRYMGAIDDRPSTRQASLNGATNYVMKAWTAVKAGQPVNPTSTKPYGCSVKYGRQ